MMIVRYLCFAALILVQACQSPSLTKQAVWGKQGFDLPVIDLDKETSMQVVVDEESGQYLGHPTTVLLPDGQTILCVYPKGHGKGGIVYKQSTDGGQTWSDRLPTPESWASSKEVPTIYSVKDQKGVERLILFSGSQDYVGGAIRMSISEDEGQTWSELAPIGDFKGIVAMAVCVPLSTPGHYLATFHTRGAEDTMVLYQVYSFDGGVTWGEPQELYRSSRAHLCEGGLIHSPDGTKIAMLLRENARNYNSQIMITCDEGQSWSAPRPMPGALCGDRHQAVYLPDGRLLVQFRDITPMNRPGNQISPTEGDWVGWIGTWEDLENGYEGQYRIRFKDNTKGWDAAYPAAEVLPDGTLVCTTYGHWKNNEAPFILSFRFQIDDIDKLLNKQTDNSILLKNER
ncbi:exo-alpha-sialidase [Carboxylicivirga sediminis]|uniref:Exo-alpha-sialidase n=1 Tax=Carboxylicivirga sediminis TaxID=2006564 RepID=A0A941F196_9BACT|nr:sialidase family protein [Carboxylicivirga sediminis]MBR8534572.1 exo-alpha-sialidase [Carboxylicivirga sediminis]